MLKIKQLQPPGAPESWAYVDPEAVNAVTPANLQKRSPHPLNPQQVVEQTLASGTMLYLPGGQIAVEGSQEDVMDLLGLTVRVEH